MGEFSLNLSPNLGEIKRGINESECEDVILNLIQNPILNCQMDPEINSGWHKINSGWHKINSGWHNQNIEITLEANPEFITREYVDWLKRIWINRISIWVQTLREKSLAEIWRCKEEVIFSALDVLEESGFDNVWVDFIVWLPHVEKWDAKKDIEMLLSRYKVIKHVSVYMLEDGKYPENWKENSLKEDELWREYEEVADFLESIGFGRYEISNFAKSGFECVHNSWYWNHTPYRWFWLSAASFTDNRRYANTQNFIGYYTGVLEYEEELTTEDIRMEKNIFDIRTKWLPYDKVLNQVKYEEFKNEMLISESWNNIKITNKWAALADYIFKELFL
ncbi:MAG: hypothetical protein ACD_3C00071G0011 [uncultured bacterium (gcode 4)]|uniref:Radical SAM core domain-containing protein n=1 Tax=uncultured bacterium (gcode 4) TaxID=1234023 RepID=K2FB60_9BACT|nr:MAG: hypothetical protein ACD_3C00071G0011 [uncultured bacterium (gcode 4)]